MSLYDDIEIDFGSTTTSTADAKSGVKKKEESSAQKQQIEEKQKQQPIAPTPSSSNVSKINLSFLKSQLEAKKALLHTQQKPTNSSSTPQTANPSPALPHKTPLVLQQQNASIAQQRKLLPKSAFKLKPHKAVPLPLDSSGAFTIVPKALKEDKVFLFGEIMVEDEYNPTAPTDYASFKQKREQQRLKEKVAKEIADRLARETTEEEEKRRKGAAIAPPTFLQQVEEEKPPEPTLVKPQLAEPSPRLFGKGVSRGLGVAASIMSRMGYREGQGLGAKEQGISRPLEVKRTGHNAGMIMAEERASTVVTHLPDIADPLNKPGTSAGWAERGAGEAVTPITELLKSATRIVLLRNMALPGQLDAEFERELRGEMAKYGQLVNVLIHQMANCSSEAEAIRIFLEFSNQAQAIKAVVDLNGRFYAGRKVRAIFYSLDDYNNRRLDLDVPP